MRRGAGCLSLALTGALLLIMMVVAQADAAGFTIKAFEAEESTSSAGLHPDFTTTVAFSHDATTSGKTEDVSVSLPPGLVGDPTAVPRCTTGQLVAFGNCPVDSQVGIVSVQLEIFREPVIEPLFNLEPPHPGQEVARLGFFVYDFPVFIDVSVRTSTDYGVTARVHDAPGQVALLFAKTTIWGIPADHSHDEQRLTQEEANECIEAAAGTACKAPGGRRESGLTPKAFLDSPAACQPQALGLAVTAYQLPGQTFEAQTAMPETSGCAGLPFTPTLEVSPTSHVAGAPTGLDTVLEIPQNEDPERPATSPMREARVTLPPGMAISAAAAQGLEGCSPAQVHLGEEVDAECPSASKLGTLTIASPALTEPLQGAIYQRAPEPGHLFRVWLVTDDFGLHVKISGDILPNPETGQLTAVFSNTPQLPVERIDLHFFGGDRAPLKNPDICGSYAAHYELLPWSGGAPVVADAPVAIDEGCAAPGFSPGLTAGVTPAVAGSFSPLVAELIRRSGEQNVGRFELTLPKGELAKLAGVPLCPDAVAVSGACPPLSKIGDVAVSSGPGPEPLWIPQPGKSPTAIYLAGPYEGAPYSVVTAVPAQAGPFDLGTVVVRAAIEIDPESAQATVKTDPLPQLIEGVPVLYRDLRVFVDRPEFTLSPTDCAPLSASAVVTSTSGTVAKPTSPFQVGNCENLAFRPKLQLSLKGSTRHAGHPALKAVLTYPKQGAYANIRRAQVNLPHSEFIDQANLDKTCTKPVLLAGNCPKKSIYGKAKAWTPLLEKPLEGPVYLVGGYGYKLPALVAELDGQIRVVLVGKVDSGPNKGIRSTFEAVPDAPVEKFELQMKGGPKYSLLENSEDLCRRPQRAITRFTAQNGRVETFKPRVQNECGKQHRHKRAGKGHRRKARK